MVLMAKMSLTGWTVGQTFVTRHGAVVFVWPLKHVYVLVLILLSVLKYYCNGQCHQPPPHHHGMSPLKKEVAVCNHQDLGV